MLYVIGRIDLRPSERLRANRLTGKTTAIHHSEDSSVPGAPKRRGEGGEGELPLLAPYSSFSRTHFFQASATQTTDPLTLRRLGRRRHPPLSEQRNRLLQRLLRLITITETKTDATEPELETSTRRWGHVLYFKNYLFLYSSS